MDSPDLLSLAVSQNLLKPKHLGQVRTLEAQARGRGLTVDPEVLLVSRGYLSTEQVKGLRRLLRIQGVAATPDPDPGNTTALQMKLGVRIRKAGLVAPDQLEECLKVQGEMRKAGVHLRIGEVLVSKGYLAPDALEAFLLVHSARDSGRGDVEGLAGWVWALIGALLLLLAAGGVVLYAAASKGALHDWFAKLFG